MFNSKRGRDASPAAPPIMPVQGNGNGKRGMFSVIGHDVVITGNISATADLHIDGRVEGDVQCGALAQGVDSQIFGSVAAENARIAGAIEGTVRVRHLTVERSARITGDVEYENITIENGGHIDGRLKHLSTLDSEAPARPVAALAAPASQDVTSITDSAEAAA